MSNNIRKKDKSIISIFSYQYIEMELLNSIEFRLTLKLLAHYKSSKITLSAQMCIVQQCKIITIYCSFTVYSYRISKFCICLQYALMVSNLLILLRNERTLKHKYITRMLSPMIQ